MCVSVRELFLQVHSFKWHCVVPGYVEVCTYMLVHVCAKVTIYREIIPIGNSMHS